MQRRIKAYEYEGSRLIQLDLGPADPEMKSNQTFSHSHDGRTYDTCCVESEQDEPCEITTGLFWACVAAIFTVSFFIIGTVIALIHAVISAP